MYKCGELISSSYPFVHSLSASAKEEYCNNCCTKNALKSCNGCKKMFYCTRNCQKNDWNAHKYECRIYSTHYHEIMGLSPSFEFVAGILRLSLILQNEPQKYLNVESLPKQKTKTRAFEHLEMHLFDLVKTPKFAEFEMLYDYFTKNNFIQVSDEEFYHNCCRFVINAIKICHNSTFVIGCGIYLLESMFNHSCIPNSTCVTIGSKIYVRAVKNIPYDTPITINYIFVEKSGDKRRQELLETYFFQCACEKCHSNLDKAFNYEQLEAYQLEQNQIAQYLIQTTKAQSVKRFNDHPEMVERFLELGVELSRMFVLIYGQYSLSNTENLCGMARILVLSTPNIEPDKVEFINKTRHHIEVTHGQEHEIYRSFQNLLSKH